MKLRYIFYAVIILSFFLLDLTTTVYALTVFAGRVHETNPLFFQLEAHLVAWLYVGMVFGMFCFIDWVCKDVNDVWWGKWSVRLITHPTGLYLIYIMFPRFLAGIHNLQVIFSLL